MLSYNTQHKQLSLPEYGRNIQRMVDHCITIEDRDERTRCAYTIIASMANLFPELKNGGNYDHKLWDHLAIMSDFKLDIDYPCEIIKPDNLTSKPDKVPYNASNVRYRHYGRSIIEMIDKAAAMPDGEERDTLVKYIANHMKKLMLGVNKDGVDDEKVFSDLTELSHGAIRISTDEMKLHEFKEAPAPTGKKKKKK
ncbi:MAG: DUF4290 domain-containing protein [Paramuribaculum sp.]|nr:DUF4290 domain-containing protein [Paramuribaculum sp.]